MFVSLTFVLYILCIYTYFKHKIAKVCNIVCAMMYSVSLFQATAVFTRTLYNTKAILCKRAVFRVPCRLTGVYSALTRAMSLHDADLILWYICMYPWQAACCTYIQSSFTRTFYSCLYIVLFFRINIQYYCIFSVYLCSFRAILVYLCRNIRFLCSFVWKNRIAQ